jgi:hypothetical protein
LPRAKNGSIGLEGDLLYAREIDACGSWLEIHRENYVSHPRAPKAIAAAGEQPEEQGPIETTRHRIMVQAQGLDNNSGPELLKALTAGWQ